MFDNFAKSIRQHLRPIKSHLTSHAEPDNVAADPPLIPTPDHHHRTPEEYILKLQGQSKRKTFPLRHELLHELRPNATVSLNDVIDDPGLESALKYTENVIFFMAMPVSLVYCLIDGKEAVIPVSSNEPSVVASMLNAVKMIGPKGVQTTITEPIVGGHVLLTDPNKATSLIELETLLSEKKEHWMEILNSKMPSMVKRGGGMRDIVIKEIPPIPEKGLTTPMYTFEFLMDVRDSMGANKTTIIAEHFKSLLSHEFPDNINVGPGILTNSVLHRMATASCEIPLSKLAIPGKSGEEVAEGIVRNHEWAMRDPARLITFVKGQLNGMAPVAIATGNDVEAFVMSFAEYVYLQNSTGTNYKVNYEKQTLELKCSAPVSLGTRGTSLPPQVVEFYKKIGIDSSETLGRFVVTAQALVHFNALKVMVGEGVMASHLKHDHRHTTEHHTQFHEKSDKPTPLLELD